MEAVAVGVRQRTGLLALVPVEVVDVQVGIGVDHGGLDVLCLAGAFPGVEAQQQAHGVDHGGAVVGGAVVGPLELPRHGGDFVDGHGLAGRREGVPAHLGHTAAGDGPGDGRH